MTEPTEDRDEEPAEGSAGGSSDGRIVTLADRLDDEARSTTDGDLERVAALLHETLGRWFELNEHGSPPSVAPSDITLAVDAAEEDEVGPGLLDDGDELGIEAVDGEEMDSDEPVDEREGVFSASATLAEVALGRPRTDDESWDDVIQELEANERSALASALWVGLATEAEVRYRSIDQWRRAVDAALRSDAAIASMLGDDSEPRSRTALVATLAAIVAIVGIGTVVVLSRAGDTIQDAAATTPEPDSSTTGGESDVTVTGADDDASTTDGSAGETSETDGTASADKCSQVGPLGPVTIDQVSDAAIVVSWMPTDEVVNILLDGAFVDTMPPEAFRYVIEQLPLSDAALDPDTDYTIGVEPRSGEASTACATTLANPVPGSEALIGVRAPTGLTVAAKSARSITVTWDPRTGADQHNLYLNGRYLEFGDIGGSSSIGDETEYTFLDLDPGTTYEIGIRRIEGPNQSGQVSITATTDEE